VKEELGIHQLILQSASGDTRSFEILYDRLHQPLVRLLVPKYCPPLRTEDIEDAIQHTFIQVWRYAHLYRGQHDDKSARSWIYKIAHRQANKMARVFREMNLKYLDEEKESMDTEGDCSSYHLVVESPDNTEQQAMTAIFVERCLLFVKSLPERDRTVFLDHYNEAKTFEEIGIKFGLSKPRVKQIWDGILLRARRVLGSER